MRWFWFIRISIIKPIHLGPFDILCQTVESNEIIWSHGAGPGLVQPGAVGELLGQVVVEQAAESHAGHEEDRDGQQSPEGGRQTPEEYRKLGLGGKIALCDHDGLQVEEGAGLDAEEDGEHQSGSVGWPTLGGHDPAHCGRGGVDQQGQQQLPAHLVEGLQAELYLQELHVLGLDPPALLHELKCFRFAFLRSKAIKYLFKKKD